MAAGLSADPIGRSGVPGAPAWARAATMRGRADVSSKATSGAVVRSTALVLFLRTPRNLGPRPQDNQWLRRPPL